jgi:hypothetical protein
MAGTIYQPIKDNSKQNIGDAASFLNKKPKRQGSNQSLDQVIQPNPQKEKGK